MGVRSACEVFAENGEEVEITFYKNNNITFSTFAKIIEERDAQLFVGKSLSENFGRSIL